jgi:cell division protein ZapA (FtsZ GTPase activity inhibitor)
LSVGVQSQPEFFAAPKDLTVNGQSLTVHSVLRAPRLREISFVPVAADESATVVSVFSQDNQESLVELTELQDRLASATALNAELTNQLSAATDDHAKVVAALNARLEAEAEQSKVMFARANELEAELNQFKTNVRLEAVKALFADLHRDYTDEAAAPYLEMSEAVFSAVATDLRSLKAPSLNESLFKDVAVKGAVPEKSETEWASQLFAQVSGVK